jgi:hypothetical protein
MLTAETAIISHFLAVHATQKGEFIPVEKGPDGAVLDAFSDDGFAPP